MSKELVRSSVRNSIGALTIDSNDYNTLTFAAITELGSKFELLEANPEVVVIVITGGAKSYFSAGAEITEIAGLMKSGDRAKATEVLTFLHSVFNKIDNSSKPVIAAINGYCLGGGLELALACDYRVANKEAVMGFPEIDLGIFPGLGGTQRLPRLMGYASSLKVLLGGKKASLSAKLAQEKGLVDKVVEGDFIVGLKSFIQDVLGGKVAPRVKRSEDDLPTVLANFSTEDNPNSAARSIMILVSVGIGKDLESALAFEQVVFVKQLFSANGIEGVTAFLEKRAPNFSGVSGNNKAKETTKPVDDAKVSAGDLSEEYKMLRETLREFCEKEVRPKVSEMEKEGRISTEILAKMADLGLFGVPFDEKYGGAGLGKTGYCILLEELSRVQGSLAVTIGASVGLAGGAISLYGTEDQKQKYLKPIAEGKVLGAFGLTEAEAGSDVANLSSSAEKRGDKWVLNGTKVFITNGDVADIIVIFAKTDKDLGQNGITAFIVEKSFPGFKALKPEHKMGIKASRTTSLEFNDMEVPEENILGRLGDGFKASLNTLNSGRLSLAAGCLGSAKRAFELAFKHASERSQMDKKLLEFQMIQSYFAKMRADIFMMEASVYNVAAKADRGEDIRLESAIVKLTASEMSERIIRTALQIHGGVGYMDEYEISRLFRDAPINTIFEGTNEIQQLLIFKEISKNRGKI